MFRLRFVNVFKELKVTWLKIHNEEINKIINLVEKAVKVRIYLKIIAWHIELLVNQVLSQIPINHLQVY
jgi:hypothetical protein